MMIRKLFLFALALLATGQPIVESSVSAQAYRPTRAIVGRSGLRVPATTAAYDSDAQAYFAAMSVQPAAARKTLINTLIVGLKSDGVWPKLDWLALLAAHDAQAALIDARMPTKVMSAINSPVFTVDRGYTGDESSSYLDFNEVYSATGNLFALNNATIGAWANAQSATVGGEPHMGATSAARTAITALSNAASAIRVNAGSSLAGDNTGSRLGHRSAVRTSATETRAFLNGTLTFTSTIASSTMATGNAAVMRSSTAYGNDRMAVVYFGSALTDADVSNLHSRLSTFLTAIGAN